MMYKWIVHKLDRKTKRRCKFNATRVGVSLSKVARRLSLLDKVLALFGMRVGAYQTADLDLQGERVVSIRLTVYFTEPVKEK